MAATRRVSIPVPETHHRDGRRSSDDAHLEGMLRLMGNGAAQPHVGLLVLHPYSLLGGSMHDMVVTEVFRQGQASRSFGAVLKYNMRGVGRSDGRRGLVSRLLGSLPRVSSCDYDALDVIHVIDFLIETMEREDPSIQGRATVALVGYSYGACLAAYGAVNHPRVCGYAGISIPIGSVASFFLKSKQYCNDMMDMQRDMPRLLVLGKNDQYTTEEQLIGCVVERVNSMSRVTDDARDGRRRVCRMKTLPDGEEVCEIQVNIFDMNDHFWGNDCALMIDHVISWLLSR